MYTDGNYTDKGRLEKFPFHGVFYRLSETINEDGSYDLSEDEEDSLNSDGSYNLDDDDDDEEDVATTSESTEDTEDSSASTDGDSDTSTQSNEVIILETPCDIQRNNALIASATITRGYKVYFPFNPDLTDLPEDLKPGILFRGEMYGLTVAGTVLDPVASQLGCCMVEIKGSDI